MSDVLPQGIERFSLPHVTVYCLRDGGKDFGPEVFPSVGDDLRAQRLAKEGLQGISTEFNAYLLRHADGALDLVDCGYGSLAGDIAGGLLGRLQALAVTPGQISRLIFTHLHGDHCGGALQDGQRVFANASVVLHSTERAFWSGKDAPGGHMLAAYEDVTEVAEGDTIAPGIRAWALPGHTPGHMGLRFDGGLVLAGDIVHSAALQLPDPDTATKYDSDADQARASRHAALAEIAAKGLVWAGSHAITGAKFARLQKDGTGYRQTAL